MPRLFGDTILRALDANGDPVSGARMRLFAPGTTTPIAAYTNPALTTLHPVPIVADSSGIFPQVHIAGGAAKVALETPDGASLPGSPVDGVPVLYIADAGALGGADRGFFADDATPAAIARLTDRVFVGVGATPYTGNRQGSEGYGGSWLTENAPSYMVKNSTLVAASPGTGADRAGFLGASISPAGGTGALNAGIMGLTVNDRTGAFGRAIYAEFVHRSTDGVTAGIEVQGGNYTGQAPAANAYSMAASRANALYIGAESGTGYTSGDADTVWTPPTQPCGAAIDISGGSLGAAYQRFVAGIVLRNGSLVRDGGTNRAAAMSMAQDHEIRWEINSTETGAKIWSDVTLADQPVGLQFSNRRVRPVGGNAERVIVDFIDDPVATGDVNWLEIRNSSTGASPSIQAAGESENLDITLTTKGTGRVRFGSFVSGSDVAITGHIEVKDTGGTIRKLAVIA